MSSPNTSPPKRRGRPPKVKEAPAPAPQPQGEVVVSIPLTELHPFPNHPFKVRDDDAMKETTESVKEYGVLTPAIVRPREAGGYEIVAGHRRKHACELAGLAALPALVRNLDDDTATILMVDSNIQRENILPSERAQAYKMKLEAIKRRGARTDLTSPNNSAKLRSDDEIGAAMGMSGDTVRNYISLTQLIPELQQMVDDKKIAVTPAYQIAALKPEEQALLVETIESEQATPSVSQAQRMKKLSQSGELNEDTMLSIMSAEKKPEVDKIVLTADTLRKYFPRSYTPGRWRRPSSSCWRRGRRSASAARNANRIWGKYAGQGISLPGFFMSGKGEARCISTHSNTSQSMWTAASAPSMAGKERKVEILKKTADRLTWKGQPQGREEQER